jgi:pimeloyl-ACP methyl ester carboxylesterase
MQVEIDGGVRLWFDVEGAGLVPDGDFMRQRPTVLLLHGGPGMDHSAFKPDFAALTDVAQIVYYDHRGQGRSDRRTPAEWTFDVWADDVVRLCDALGIEKPIVLGNSFGGMVAMHYAARHPDHPGKLVLSSTAARMNIDAMAEMFEHLGGAGAAATARAFWADPTDANRDAYLSTCGPLYTQSPGNLFDTKRAIRNNDVTTHFIRGEQRTMDLRAGLARIACPTLVLAGGLDPVCPPTCAREIAEAIDPTLVRLELFEQCGHGVFRDDPARAFRTLLDFVA